jgi:hypothetical protein
VHAHRDDLDHRQPHGDDVNRLSRFSGVVLAVVLVGLPTSVPWVWPALARAGHPVAVRVLVSVAAGAWVWFVVALIAEVRRQRTGEARRHNAVGWLAAMITTCLVLSVAPTTTATPTHHGTMHIVRTGELSSVLPLALAAKRRRDTLLHERQALNDDEADAILTELDGRNDELLDALAKRLPATRDGVVTIDPLHDHVVDHPGPVVILPLGGREPRWCFAFARIGGQLSVPTATPWHHRLVVLRGGPLVVTTSAHATLRALATRPHPETMVVHASDEALDDDLAALCVRIHVAETRTSDADEAALRVELLRSEPRIVGLSSPPPREMARRIVEVVAYLALHRTEGVSGERLRARVLGRGRQPSSPRALANVMSVARRVLEADAHGPRLHAVGPGDPYRTHGITTDVTEFTTRISAARDATDEDQRHLLAEALALVQGEPLVATAHTWDWFLAEGWLGRLARDGEWAALTLAAIALRANDVHQAWWALEQGRLLDPWSDALLGALARVPRQASLAAIAPADCNTTPSAPAVE